MSPQQNITNMTLEKIKEKCFAGQKSSKKNWLVGLQFYNKTDRAHIRVQI